jgi:5'-deoxynucleotidase
MEELNKQSSFYALVFRQKHIMRWGLMRNAFPESLAAHSSECAILAHALATIGNTLYGRDYDVGKVVTMALFHDVPEVFTGDMPTPVKYANSSIRGQFAAIEAESTAALIDKLPQALRDGYAQIFDAAQNDEKHHKLLKAADRLCAYIKCTDEERFGNTEFSGAKKGIEERLRETDMPELQYFMENFLPAFGMTLDDQQGL